MKSIPTYYDGIEYKSRLEAKWACFFDKLNIIAQYEPFYIKNDGLEYLPDFYTDGLIGDCHIETNKNEWLGDLLCFVEIKPIIPNESYLNHLLNVRKPGECAILGLCGDIFYDASQFKAFLIHGHKKNELLFSDKLFFCEDCNKMILDWSDYNWCEPQCRCSICVKAYNPLIAFNYVKDYRFDL
jgi:hypothetical protein